MYAIEYALCQYVSTHNGRMPSGWADLTRARLAKAAPDEGTFLLLWAGRRGEYPVPAEEMDRLRSDSWDVPVRATDYSILFGADLGKARLGDEGVWLAGEVVRLVRPSDAWPYSAGVEGYSVIVDRNIVKVAQGLHPLRLMSREHRMMRSQSRMHGLFILLVAVAICSFYGCETLRKEVSDVREPNTDSLANVTPKPGAPVGSQTYTAATARSFHVSWSFRRPGWEILPLSVRGREGALPRVFLCENIDGRELDVHLSTVAFAPVADSAPDDAVIKAVSGRHCTFLVWQTTTGYTAKEDRLKISIDTWGDWTWEDFEFLLQTFELGEK